MSDWLIAVILGFVEGVTEFVPVSSTGHLILVGHAFGFTGTRATTFDVVIQLGALLALVILRRERLFALCTLRAGSGFAGRRGVGLLSLTTAPALVVGAAAHDGITARLFNPIAVTVGLGVGGFALLASERYRSAPGHADLDDFQARHALIIGLFQCLALWPGVSRSAATIVGARLTGATRVASAEYSFLAALPLLGAAALVELAQNADSLAWDDLPIFAVGFTVAFVAAWGAIKTFLAILARTTLRPFAWYRLAVAFGVLLVLIGRT